MDVISSLTRLFQATTIGGSSTSEVKSLRSLYLAGYDKHKDVFQNNTKSNTTLIKKKKGFEEYVVANTRVQSVKSHTKTILKAGEHTEYSIGITTFLEEMKDASLSEFKPLATITEEDGLVLEHRISSDENVNAKDFTHSINSKDIGTCLHYILEEKLIQSIPEQQEREKLLAVKNIKPEQLVDGYKTPKIIDMIISYIQSSGYELVSVEFPVAYLGLPVCKTTEKQLRWLSGRLDFVLYHPKDGVVLFDFKTGGKEGLIRKNVAQLHMLVLALRSMGYEVNRMKIIKIDLKKTNANDILHYKTGACFYSIPYSRQLSEYLIIRNEIAKSTFETVTSIKAATYMATVKDILDSIDEDFMKGRPDRTGQQQTITILTPPVTHTFRIYRLSRDVYVIINYDKQQLITVNDTIQLPLDLIPSQLDIQIGSYKELVSSEKRKSIPANDIKQLLMLSINKT